jgi:hypothetical protein
MTNLKVEMKPWQPHIDREPEFNPFANPRYLWLENPPPWSETVDDDSTQSPEDAADAERQRR